MSDEKEGVQVDGGQGSSPRSLSQALISAIYLEAASDLSLPLLAPNLVPLLKLHVSFRTHHFLTSNLFGVEEGSGSEP